MTEGLGGHVSDEGGHDKLEESGNQLVRPPRPKVLRSHRPRIPLLLGLGHGQAGQRQSQNFPERVHVEITVTLKSLVTSQELWGQHHWSGDSARADGRILLLPPGEAVHAEHAVELESGNQKGQHGRGQGDPHCLEQRRLRQHSGEGGAVEVQRGQLAPHRLRLEAVSGPGGGRKGGQVAEGQGEGPKNEIRLAGEMEGEESAHGADDNVDAQAEGEVESHESGPQGRLNQDSGNNL